MTPHKIDVSATAEIVNRISAKFARSVYSTSQEDLRQEAWRIALEAVHSPSIDIARYEAYITRAIQLSLTRYCWKNTSPVSCSKPEKVKICSAVSYEGPYTMGSKEVITALCMELRQSSSFERQLAIWEAQSLIEKTRKALITRMAELYNAREGNAARAPNPRFNASVEVLLNNAEPKAAAASVGEVPSKVYATTKWLKNRLIEDRQGKRLLATLAENRAVL